MADFVPLWERTSPLEGGRQAEAFFVCFSQGPLREGLKLQVDRFGIPSVESYRELDVRRVIGAEARGWFEGWRVGSLRTIAERDLGAALAALDAATECHTVRATLLEPEDLGYLQACWAVVRWLTERGVSCALDVHAGRFLAAEAVRAVPADAPFALEREVAFICETDAASPAGLHYMHTRGMRKFGRPDLVAEIELEDVEVVGQVFVELATAMADGWLPAARHGVDLDEDLTLYLEPYRPGPDADLQLNNDGVLLVDGAGKPVAGVAQQLT
jgi:hypothetical protein